MAKNKSKKKGKRDERQLSADRMQDFLRNRKLQEKEEDAKLQKKS